MAARGTPGAPGTVRLGCVGDVMCGDSFYAVGHGVSTSIDDAGPRFLDEDLVAHLRSHDVVFGNLECPLSDVGRRDRSLRSLHMRARASTGKLLAGWGLTVANVANNHILEHGREAAVDTARQLRAVGILPVGAGTDDTFDDQLAPVRLEAGGLGLSFLGVCTLDEPYAHNGFRSQRELTDAVADERADGRSVVVSLHWGHEFVDRPSARQVRLAQDLVGAGASLVLGHHPHVPHGLWRTGDALVAFSLGNFVFNGFEPDTRWSFVLSVELSQRGVERWSTLPVAADATHAPRLASGVEGLDLQAELDRRSDIATSALDEPEEDYDAEVRRLCEDNRRLLRRELRSRALRYDPVFVPQILARPVLRRMGRW